ncbi:hypothetical protein [Ensifer adhaerens]|uniref:hypothetical protein n=1 Tax=Ensifer adhaerens TaxID=106592 RepID=UPI003F87CCF3
MVEEFGLPGERWRDDHLRRFDRFIEVQVWDERPVLEFRRKSEMAMGARPPV